MKKTKLSREAKIGIYGICMILLLYLGINFIKSQDIFSRDNTYYAVYDNSDGIEASSPVTIKGFRVGTVDNVWYDVPTGKVIAEFSVKSDYPVPADSKAKIASASLMGAKVIDLQLGTDGRLLEDGDTIRSLMEPGLMQLVTSEYDKIKEMATSLVERVSKALDGVNAVLSEENAANLSGPCQLDQRQCGSHGSRGSESDDGEPAFAVGRTGHGGAENHPHRRTGGYSGRLDERIRTGADDECGTSRRKAQRGDGGGERCRGQRRQTDLRQGVVR